jgi:hypothetical protein
MAYICCYKIVKIMVTGLITGFFIGILVGGLYASWFIRTLKKNGYAKFKVTQKFMDEMK